MDHSEAATFDVNGSPDDPQIQSEDPEIMALLFNSTHQSSELPLIHWQDHGTTPPYYGSCDHAYNPSLLESSATQFVVDGCYSFFGGDMSEPNVVASSNGSVFMPMDFFVIDEKNNTEDPQEEPTSFREEMGSTGDLGLPRKRKNSWDEIEGHVEVREDENSVWISRKKPNAPKNGNKVVQQSKRGKKCIASKANDSEDCKTAYVRQNSMSSSSEDDSVTSHETNGGFRSPSSSKDASGVTTNSNAKARARHGSATDPQSLYARKRRERINERLRILQRLVPNGTKVDISTMLEEAVQYVKFLQLQIKLLSSDDMWMYAPIAYNGKDIGLDHINIGDIGSRI